MAASEESDFAYPLTPPFQYKNGQYNEVLLKGLDFLLAEMGKRNMRAVLVLNNYWDWTGGMSEYVAWALQKDVVDPTRDSTVTWNDFLDFSARFYTIDEAQNRYRAYINMLVSRPNTFTQTLYKNDPTIMTWELANEPRPSKVGDSQKSIEIFSSWVDETASFIHSIDANHLVTTGSEGSKGTLNSLDFTRQAHVSKFIDYMTVHLWPKNWGWYKPNQPQKMASTKQKTYNYLTEHIEIAADLKKPIVLEEFGFMRDGEKYSPKSPVKARNEFYQYVFQFLNDEMKKDSPVAGSNFWGWGGEGRTQHSDYKWKIGDTIYVADPYSEPQGLNSVFNNDMSTLEIIKKYAQKADSLSNK